MTSSFNGIKKIKDFQEEINKEWTDLKLYLKQFIKEKNISYWIFIDLVKREHEELKTAYISTYMLYTLKDMNDNNINLSNKPKMANKLYMLLENFKNRYENEIDYKNSFDERLSNVDVELICKTKIDEIFEVFKEIGFSHIDLIEYSSDKLKFDVTINLSVFDCSQYKFTLPIEQMLSPNHFMIENNKSIIKKIIKENVTKFEIIDDNVDIDINNVCLSRYLYQYL